MNHNVDNKVSFVLALLRGAVVGLVLIFTFLAGFWLRGAPQTMAAGISPVNDASSLNQESQQYVLLAQAQALVNDHFVRQPPEPTQLEYGAIRGMLQSLNDKYTFFIEPPVAASESNVLAGHYGGIGVQVTRDEQGRFALYPFRDGPAAKAGVQDGDVLTKINDTALDINTQPDQVDQALRGEVKDNNGVKIHVMRPASSEELDFQIAFAEIEIPSVNWRVLAEDADLGYIQIMRFTARTPAEVTEAINDLRTHNIKGVVLDFRNNPGGLLQESVQVAGQFMNGGVVLYEESRNEEKPYPAPEPEVRLADLPMVVLINGGTASAAELVAGALRDSGRAILLGQKSYGKGSIQLIFPLADKSSIHITTAQWLTPAKTQIDGVGLQPDVPMIPDANGRDVELGEAIRNLKAKLTS